MNVLDKLKEDAMTQELLASLTDEELKIWEEYVESTLKPMAEALQQQMALVHAMDRHRKRKL